MIRRLLALTAKEWRNVVRRDFTYLVLVQPIIFSLVWGFCATLDLRKMSLAVLDGAGTPKSREIARTLEGSGRFEVTRHVRGVRELEGVLASGEASAALVIPSSFATDLSRGRGGAVGVFVDGTDAVASTTGLSYAVAVTRAVLEEPPTRPPASLRAWYNPSLRSVDLLLLGAICYNLVFFSVYPATSLLMERESGSMIPLGASPATSLELYLATILPNSVIAIWGTLVQVAFMIHVAGVPFRGDPWLFGAALAVIALIHMNIGCMLARLSGTLTRLTVLNIVVNLVFIAISGFLIPMSYLPGWAQRIGQFVPMTHSLELVRAIWQKGATWDMVQHHFATLGIFAAATAVLGWLCVRSLLESTRG